MFDTLSLPAWQWVSIVAVLVLLALVIQDYINRRTQMKEQERMGCTPPPMIFLNT